ncbi:MAG: M23 family metallopeptidase [Anaerolineaceae bacterium]|nr:M23 family metallopeptidase [Anaerolineaceae bacterium]
MRRMFFLVVMLLAVMLPLAGISKAQQLINKPLILPFQDGPALDTWLLGQAYGNTTGAYNFGDLWYSAGQGLHFGLDFSAACGTPLVAVADGVVAYVDNLSFGSAPHNLILRHDAIGLTSLYGHLLDRAPVTEGQIVKQGELVGYSGDPDETCFSRPHLHLEIRSSDYRTTYNPVNYMQANWHTLALVGRFGGRFFQIDLNNARQWQSLEDQPDVAFGGRRLNAYTESWPLLNNQLPPLLVPPDANAIDIPQDTPVTMQMLDGTGCCPDFWWHSMDANTLYTLDGAPGSRASVYTWDADAGQMVSMGPETPYLYSPDFSHTVAQIGDNVQILELATGIAWQVNTNGNPAGLNASNTHLMWVERESVFVPGQTSAVNAIYMADVRDRSGNYAPIQVLAERGLDGNWLDDHRLLVTWREDNNTRIDIVDINTGQRYNLGTWYRPRGFSIAPGGSRMVYYLSSQPDPADNGMYLIDIAEGSQPQRLDWFGAYRWRDENSLFVIPFEPENAIHELGLFTVADGQLRMLTVRNMQPFAVMNGQWDVNADGSKIAFRNALDGNFWMMDLK